MGVVKLDFTNIKYTSLISYIENTYKRFEDWNSILDLSVFKISEDKEETLNTILGLTFVDEQMSLANWEKLITYLMNKNKEKKIVKLAKDISSDAKIPLGEYTNWVIYKNKLKKKGWSQESIQDLERSSFETLQYLDMDTSDRSPVRGLVVGNVQSGKTANMAGLIAMAADNGFNYFVILSGVIEKLREQTAKRIYDDMNPGGNGNLSWNQVDNPSIRSKKPEHDISKFNLHSKSKDRYFTVLLKNSKRLESFISWLYSDKQKASQLKILIIDDEADQASVNTNDIEEENPTKINELLKTLVHSNKVSGMNYIAYTATPYANVLNESGKGTLYPHDFILLLNTPKEYIGPKEIFGLEEPESVPKIDIVREITDYDAEVILESQSNHQIGKIPKSFKDAIQWFLISVVGMRSQNYTNPISMLIHTSMKVTDHEIIKQLVTNYLLEMRSNSQQSIEEMKILYENETVDFTRDNFIDGMAGYDNIDQVKDYPEWSVIEKYLTRLFRLEGEEYLSHILIGEEGEPKYHKGIHLVVDNSQAKSNNQIIRLVYPSKKQNVAPAFIVIGGNTLSRGLTIEGLVSTFFIRDSKQADTLMQMGRWFGYRKGYELFPRVYLTDGILEKFSHLSQMNEELREEIEVLSDLGISPENYAIKVKNSPNHNWLKITSDKKMQSAYTVDFDFSGFNSQTVYFENKPEIHKQNIINTTEFLNQLETPEIYKGRMIFRDVETENVLSFFEKYKVCSLDRKMSNLPALVKWLETNTELDNWNVILSSKGKIEAYNSLNNLWNIHGYSPDSVVRTKLIKNSTNEITNIGTLRSPSNLLIDLHQDLEKGEERENSNAGVQRIRRKYGYGNTPLLFIYRIDKDSTPDRNLNTRTSLNFDTDIIGIEILLPGSSRAGLSKTVSIKINKDGTFNELGE